LKKKIKIHFELIEEENKSKQAETAETEGKGEGNYQLLSLQLHCVWEIKGQDQTEEIVHDRLCAFI